MKKFVPIFLIAIFSVFMFLPVLSVDAAEEPTLKMPATMMKCTDFDMNCASQGMSVYMTDGGFGYDFATLTATSTNTTSKDGLMFTFANPIDVSTINIGLASANGRNTMLTFYNKDKVSVGGEAVTGSGTKTLPYKNVSYIYVENKLSASEALSEFYVKGVAHVDAPAPIYDEVTNLQHTETDKSVGLTWTNPTSSDFQKANIYKNGVKVATVLKPIDVYMDSDVLPNTSYTYKVTSIYADGHETNGVSTSVITPELEEDLTKIPPSNVVDLAVSHITDTSLELSWLNPEDTDLDKVNIYKDGTLIQSLDITSSYKVIELTPNTTYNFSVSVVDRDGNESPRQSINATTIDGKDNVAPDAPKGLTVEAGNKVLYLKWNKNLEDDLLGYNVFVNGVKQNTIPIKNTFFTIADLSNGTDYNVSISAVDTSSNESPRTTEKQGIPNEDGMPLLSTDYDLIDVAKGVENWFSSFWLIIAFAIAIPLSFYIASRIKLMFLE